MRPDSATLKTPAADRVAAAARLSAAWTPLQVPEPAAALLRGQQMQAVLRLTPLVAAANALNAALLLLLFRGSGHAGFLMLWSLGLAAILLLWLRAWRRQRARPQQRPASTRATRRAVLHAALLGVLWGVVPLVLFPHAPPSQQIVLATLVTGMVCAGGFALSTVPVAGTVYVGLLTAGALGALLLDGFEHRWVLGGLLLVYSLTVLASLWANAWLFVHRWAAESNAARQGETVSLLLRDFEAHASDVLWEIDAERRLVHPSRRLAALLGRRVAALQRVDALALLAPWLQGHDAGRAQWAELDRRLREGRPFRDLGLTFGSGPATRSWSLTAKPLQDLQGRTIGWRGVARDTSVERRAGDQLKWMAHFDGLTGLANRRHFQEALQALLERRPTPAFALAIVDLDRFKAINDGHGHAAGDAVLQAVAQRLQEAVRHGDIVARLGGDEFAVLALGVGDADEATALGARVFDRLSPPLERDGRRHELGASVGVALAPRDGLDADTLFSHADTAMYVAKGQGRGRLALFEPSMAEGMQRRRRIERALRNALAHGELSLVFQPQVDASAWRITGFEALLRWTHPELGVVAPAEFIGVAEESGSIQAIGAWVLQQACRQAARWPDDIGVAVNVSAAQVRDGGLARAVQEAAAAAGVATSRIELEVTESVLMHDRDAAIAALAAVRKAGARVALDDFGTGYSSLAYLSRLPCDTLKIDRSFVGDMAASEDARVVVRTLFGLAHTLGLRTVVEGVEQAPFLAMLRSWGDHAVQGDVVARPMPAEEVPGLLRGWSARPHPEDAAARG